MIHNMKKSIFKLVKMLHCSISLLIVTMLGVTDVAEAKKKSQRNDPPSQNQQKIVENKELVELLRQVLDPKKHSQYMKFILNHPKFLSEILASSQKTLLVPTDEALVASKETNFLPQKVLEDWTLDRALFIDDISGLKATEYKTLTGRKLHVNVLQGEKLLINSAEAKVLRGSDKLKKEKLPVIVEVSSLP